MSLTSTIDGQHWLKYQNVFLNYFGVMPQSRAEHTVCRSILALRVGMKTMMRCRPVGSAMMHCLPADIPHGVLSLADEVDEWDARPHTSTT